MIYLDANATEPLRPEAREAVLAALDLTGNPSSVHAAGRAARRLLEDAREAVAGRFGGAPADLIFTSGGTEADLHAVRGLGAGRRIVVNATEHDAIRSAAPDARIFPVGADGIADLDGLADLLTDRVPTLVCLMAANNETGVIQPVAAAAALCRRFGALLHVDAVQAAGRVPTSLRELGAHSMALSSHKLGGPPGAGALLLAADAPPIAALIAGGGQERGRRGGTPALPAIAGFAAAAQAAAVEQVAAVERVAARGGRLAAMRNAIERAAISHGAIVCGGAAPRLGNTSCIALPGVRADAQVIALDLDGFAVSAGAACSSGKVTASHVLAAMGLGGLAGQAIRISLPWNARPEHADAFSDAYRRIADRLRRTLAPRAA